MKKNWSLFNVNAWILLVFFVMNLLVIFDAGAWFRIIVLHDLSAHRVGITWMVLLLLVVSDVFGVYQYKKRVINPDKIKQYKQWSTEARWLTEASVLAVFLLINKMVTDLTLTSFLFSAIIFYYFISDIAIAVLYTFLDKKNKLSFKLIFAVILLVFMLFVLLLNYLDKRDIEKHVYTVSAVSVKQNDGEKTIATVDGNLSVKREFEVVVNDKINIEVNFSSPKQLCNRRTTQCTPILSGRLKRYYFWNQ